MTRDEFKAAVAAIGACEDDSERRALLLDLEEKTGADYDSLQSVTDERDKLQQANESLQTENRKLFLRITEPKPTPKQEPDKKLKFEDLFNEKGELK